jgi:hypothetical protein
MGMNNMNRVSIINAVAGIPALGLKAGFRVYTLGSGADTQLLFSMRLWLAAAQRQERLARCAAH